jgi:predicted metal-dependent phosphoesterase TrpH
VTQVVQFSTGIGSAEVARRVIETHGRENVELLTADTMVEDEDNWRFGREVVAYLEWKAEENQTRELLGKDVSILRDRTDDAHKPLPLTLFRTRIEANATLFDADDWGACGCYMGGAA